MDEMENSYKKLAEKETEKQENKEVKNWVGEGIKCIISSIK